MNQLLEYGIASGKIFLCQCIHGIRCDVFPLIQDQLEDLNKELIIYDLLNTSEEISEHKKILIFVASYSVYTKQLIENMSQYYNDVEYALITNASESKELILSKMLKHIYYYRSMAELKIYFENCQTMMSDSCYG